MSADGDLADAALAAGGDLAAFERLYRRHAPRMHSLARRLLGPADADDGVQDIFLRARDRIGSFRGRGGVRDVAAPARHERVPAPRRARGANRGGHAGGL